MKCYGRAAINEFVGDRIVYRNLAPVDPNVPSLRDACCHLHLEISSIPRKTSIEYARILSFMLEEARRIDCIACNLERVVFIGDTRMNDGMAFKNICEAGNWPGMAFIGSERNELLKVELEQQALTTIYSANRWTALFEFQAYLAAKGFVVDERTAVLLDMDKTILGARGRNDHRIDRARTDAAFRLAGDLLGASFDKMAFQTAYQTLNQPEFHPFTADNQDYLVYICLMINNALYNLEDLLDNIRNGKMESIDRFVFAVHSRLMELPEGLRETHRQFFERFKEGDPTPFKSFRRYEYQNTASSMGYLEDNADVEHLLKDEIVMTREVRELSLAWKNQGALIFSLSDKPDEASMPTEELASQGFLPLHQIVTHVVGE